MTKGWFLNKLTWGEAARLLSAERPVVLPLGAQAKEHGLHLPLETDYILAMFLAEHVVDNSDVILAPPLNYSFYPAFTDYPGSVSLSAQTAGAMVVEICVSLSRAGARRFYVLNTGISTIRILAQAENELARQGILLGYTDLGRVLGALEAEILEQEGGSHADEGETSIMLVINPEVVDMSLAACDFQKDRQGPLSPDPDTVNCYSKSGVWGDARLATKDKGLLLVEKLKTSVCDEIELLRKAPLPEPEGM